MKKYEEQRRFKLKIGQPDFEVRSPSDAPSENDSVWPLLNQVAKSARGEPAEPPSDWHLPDTVDVGEDEYRWYPGRDKRPSGEQAARAAHARANQLARDGAGAVPEARAATARNLRLGRSRPATGRSDPRHHHNARDHQEAGEPRAGGNSLLDRRYARRPSPLRPARSLPAGHNGTPLKSLLKGIAERRQRPSGEERL